MTIPDIDKQLAEAITRRDALFAEYSQTDPADAQAAISDDVLATRIEYAQKRIDALLDERGKVQQCA